MTDIIKMVAYQAESDLFALLRPHYARADQEGRTLLHELFATAGDIRVSDSELHIIAAVVFDEAQLPKFVHEKADPGPSGADHLGERLLADFRYERLWFFLLAKICHDEKQLRRGQRTLESRQLLDVPRTQSAFAFEK